MVVDDAGAEDGQCVLDVTGGSVNGVVKGEDSRRCLARQMKKSWLGDARVNDYSRHAAC